MKMIWIKTITNHRNKRIRTLDVRILLFPKHKMFYAANRRNYIKFFNTQSKPVEIGLVHKNIPFINTSIINMIILICYKWIFSHKRKKIFPRHETSENKNY